VFLKQVVLNEDVFKRNKQLTHEETKGYIIKVSDKLWERKPTTQWSFQNISQLQYVRLWNSGFKGKGNGEKIFYYWIAVYNIYKI